MVQQVQSLQVADSIDVKAFKAAFQGKLLYSDEAELFYRMDEDELISVFKYGVVCFLNTDAIQISAFLQVIAPYLRNPFREPLREEYQVITNAPKARIGFQSVEIPTEDPQALRLIMLHVSHSVALDHYSEQTSKLLEETNYHTQKLEDKGRLDISGTKLKRYIGRTLLLKNRIAENLYIFDSPDETWENEQLDKLDMELKRTFDLQQRVRNIHEGLAITKDNLDLFQALLQYRNSTMLEWIVILLILVEVVNMIIEKVF
jgi:required for meiotic nuclear division protein 1